MFQPRRIAQQADKVPVVDSIFQVLQWPVAMAAGAILFASQNSVLSEVSPGLTIVILFGLLVASVSTGKALSELATHKNALAIEKMIIPTMTHSPARRSCPRMLRIEPVANAPTATEA